MDRNEAVERLCDGLRAKGVHIEGCRFLLAVSGGLDSMCMLVLMKKAGLAIDVAHVNYGLRGQDSYLDEALVKAQCYALTIAPNTKHIDLALEREPGESLQSAARRLRYAWFEMLLEELNYDYLCTAHHMDDKAETFFINLLRGSGIAGLTGIPAQRDHIVRPMLVFTRKEIESIAEDLEIPYREDSSNLEDTYLRNRIRHHIIDPLLREDPRFLRRLEKSQDLLNRQSLLLHRYLDTLRADLLTIQPDKEITIRLGPLASTPSAEVVLWHCVGAYGFNLYQCSAAVSERTNAGAMFLSATHKMYRAHDHLRVVPVEGYALEGIEISSDTGRYILPDGLLELEPVEKPVFSDESLEEVVDRDKLGETLELRSWYTGDAFYPLGAGGRQKLQDFFSNRKLSIPQKHRVRILVSGGKIVWVVGMRLDERFKVTEDTQRFLALRWTPVDAD